MYDQCRHSAAWIKAQSEQGLFAIIWTLKHLGTLVDKMAVQADLQ